MTKSPLLTCKALLSRHLILSEINLLQKVCPAQEADCSIPIFCNQVVFAGKLHIMYIIRTKKTTPTYLIEMIKHLQISHPVLNCKSGDWMNFAEDHESECD